MSNLFANIARKTVTLSPLMEGRTKLPMRDVIDTYTEGVHVTAFDYIPGRDKQSGESTTYPVILISEAPDSFVFGGTVMKAICDAWVEHFDGDVESCNAALSKSGGVLLKFTRDVTKNGNTITRVTVL